MAPPQSSFPRPPKRVSASPAERGAEYAEAQKRLKEEAAERRLAAAERPVGERPVRHSANDPSRRRG